MSRNILIVIVGPTAIGKTALSIALAKHFQCAILSCDSRQFYKEMCIGTAVPSNEELSQATHYCIQHQSIHTNYSVGDFERQAIPLLDSLFEKHSIQIMVGGSGLYVDSITNGLDNFPDIEPNIRINLQDTYQQQGLEYLQQTLKNLDYPYYQKLINENPQTLKNPQRMLRFVEVCLGTGKPYSSFLEKEKVVRNFTPIFIGLQADREQLYNRINQRVDTMMLNGLLDEVTKLHPYAHLNALQTVGYKELFMYLEGKISLENALEEIKKNTRRFAKRQLTWFKRNNAIQWFDYNDSTANVVQKIISLAPSPLHSFN